MRKNEQALQDANRQLRADNQALKERVRGKALRGALLV